MSQIGVQPLRALNRIVAPPVFALAASVLPGARAEQQREAAKPEDLAARRAPLQTEWEERLQVMRLFETITPSTPPDDLLLTYLRDNADRLHASGVLYEIGLSRGALENPAVTRIVHAQYAKERAAGRMPHSAIQVLARAGFVAIAPELWEDWKNAPSYTRPAKFGWGEMAAERSHPKCVLARAIFELGDGEVIPLLWRSFGSMPPGDQILVAQAADVLDPFLAREVVRHLDAAKDDTVRGEMINAANRILTHSLTHASEEDREWAVQNAKPVVAELAKRNAIRDYLARTLANLGL